MALDEQIVSSLPEEIRNEPSFAEIQKGDLPGVFKNLIDSQKTLGRAILLPDEKDPDDKKAERMNSIYEKLGRPKEHKAYDLKGVLPEGMEVEKVEPYLKAFHKAGLSTSQAQEVVKAYLEEQGKSSYTVEKAVETLSTGDEKNPGWGDKTKENIGIAKRALTQAFDPEGEFTDFLEQTGLGNHPVVLRYFHRIGSTLKEDSTPRIQQRAGEMDKETAQSKLAEIMNNKEHPYWSKSKAGHAEAVEEVKKLNQFIHGNKVESVVGTH